MATVPWTIFVHWVWGSESNMLLYYLVLRGWLGFLAIVGLTPSETLLRLPSAVFAVAAAAAVYWLGRHLFGWVAGLVAGGLFLANFLQIILAQSARAYSLGLLLLSVSWLALFIALETDKRRWWWIYAAAGLLSVYALLLSSLVILSQLLALGALLILPGPWRARVRRSLRKLVLTNAVIAAGVLPLGLDAVLHGGSPLWVPPARLSDLRYFAYFLTGQSRAYEYLIFALAGVGCLLAASVLLPSFGRLIQIRADVLGTAVAMCFWFAVPIAVSYALTQPALNLHLFFTRYLVTVVPPLCLLAGLGVQALRVPVLQAALVVALTLVAVPPLNLYYANAEVQNFKEPTLWIQDHFREGDGVVCDPEVQCGVPVAYYLETQSGPAHIDPDSPGYFSWASSSSTPLSSEFMKPYESRHRRIFFIYGPLGRTPPFDAGAATLEASLRADGYRLVDQTSARGSAVTISVALYEAG